MDNKNWKKTKTIYWSDERHDDFDEVGLSRPGVPKGYKYERRNHFQNFFYNIFYYIIAIPLISVWMFFMDIKVKYRKNLKEIKHKGAFIYSNHVAITDVTKFHTRVFPFRRVNILGYSDSLSIPVAKHLVRSLGYLPLPLKGDIENMAALTKAFKYYTNEKKQIVLIFPEAHIWPYYTKIRNFSAGSFYYPAFSNAPVLPIVTTWRKVWYSKKPKPTLLIGKAIYPKPELDVNENKIYLHDECLKAMKELSESVTQYEYIKYIYVEKEDKKSIV